jgi:hypothetical protein
MPLSITKSPDGDVTLTIPRAERQQLERMLSACRKQAKAWRQLAADSAALHTDDLGFGYEADRLETFVEQIDQAVNGE